MDWRKRNKELKRTLSRSTNGSTLNIYAKNKDPGLSLLHAFGCLRCPFAGSKNCPHEISYGGSHKNGICGHRLDYLKSELKKCKTMTRLIQGEELFKLKQISDNFIWQYHEDGNLSDEFKHISKLIVSLTDKMRRQDEGMKIAGEISVEVKNFQNIIDVQAKAIEGKDIIKEAELIGDSDKPDNRAGKDRSGEEVQSIRQTA